MRLLHLYAMLEARASRVLIVLQPISAREVHDSPLLRLRATNCHLAAREQNGTCALKPPAEPAEVYQRAGCTCLLLTSHLLHLRPTSEPPANHLSYIHLTLSTRSPFSYSVLPPFPTHTPTTRHLYYNALFLPSSVYVPIN